ncbi:MAG: ferredoxin [Pseudomonadales bacterium]|nr:ferredoxin [Pseudomonadales bacterium]MCP5182494.1 ferredoxin [Pseudomonadales bacterium]
MKCRIDPSLCEGHHRCSGLYPDLFEVGQDNKARVKFGEVPEDFEIDAQSAANSCPAGAIVIEY